MGRLVVKECFAASLARLLKDLVKTIPVLVAGENFLTGIVS